MNMSERARRIEDIRELRIETGALEEDSEED